MKLILNKNRLGMNPEQFLRRAGYGYIRDGRTGQESFVRRLGEYFYPRLHMYFEERGEQVVFNLHLDQKKAMYEGARAHNADYDGQVVKKEIERLEDLVNQVSVFPASSIAGEEKGSEEMLDGIGGDRNYAKNVVNKKKSWLRRVLGI